MPDDLQKPTVKEFFRVLWKNLGALLSGSLSVPFSFLAVFTNSSHTRPIYSALAVTGILITIYQMWSKERGISLKIQNELKDEIAKRGRPEITLELQSHDQKQLHICLMNYTKAPAVNLRVPDIRCANGEVLRFGPIPVQVSLGFSPSLQCLRVSQDDQQMWSDISVAFDLKGETGNSIAESLLFAVYYTDVEACAEWVSFCSFSFRKGTFVFEKQWIASS